MLPAFWPIKMGNLTGIGTVANTALPITDHIAYRIGGIVGNPKRSHLQIANLQDITSRKFLMDRQLANSFFTGRKSPAINISGNFASPGNNSDTTDMIIMFMGNTKSMHCD